MIVALTGATGFIGSYTARALHGAGHAVRALVRSSSRRDHIAPHVAQFVEGDMTDPQALAGLVAGAQCVIHTAIDGDAYERSPDTHFRNNLSSSLRLLEAARLAGVGQFIFVGSTGVYARDLPPIDIDETFFPQPTNLYGAYKLAVETNVIAYHHDFGMNTSVFRPAGVYGVDPVLKRSRWFDLVRKVKQGETVEAPGVNRITHIDDVASAMVLAIDDPETAGQIYNLVDCYFPDQTVAEIAKELTGSSATIIDRRPTNALPIFNTTNARDFFARHGNTTALTHADSGVRVHLTRLLSLIS